MTSGPQAQGALTDYALHTLGWKSFQDLCIAVATEVLNRPVQAFLPSKDGGRDGAFIGTWLGSSDIASSKSTIQCKFTSKPAANLSLSSTKEEISKIPRLSRQGLADDYILMTNFGVSAEAEMSFTKQVIDAGAKQCRIFGRDWITNEIRSRPRLRMMVPRLYGLGDLSQIIDERAYAQAKLILSSMGDDLSCFVTMQAHRQSVSAINDHKFVLLLGDPASGKSTIGASLAIGSLDDGALGAVKINSPDQFDDHWNPSEPNQFFWIDDAFGATQYQRSLADEWNARLRSLRAAARGGARIVMTSRNYIWNSAQRDLKTSEFPLFKNSQVIIDVQNLQEKERNQILYNHIKLGDQTSKFKKDIKPYLADVAMNKAFLPETARRLGNSFFTAQLYISDHNIANFVEHPVEFLVDILRGFDESAEAAVAIVFLHGIAGAPSPIGQSAAFELVLRLTGVSPAAATRSLEALRGSLTLLLDTESGPRWFFKHPTISDAYSALLSESPEKIELYVRGAKLERLLDEIVCGDVIVHGAKIRVPALLYETILSRINGYDSTDKKILAFLARRADRHFLRLFIDSRPEIFEIVDSITSDLRFNFEIDVIAKLHHYGLLPEPVRLKAVKHIRKLATDWADVAVFNDENIRNIFKTAEFNSFVQSFDSLVIKPFESDPVAWGANVSSDDMASFYRSYQESLAVYRDFRVSRKKSGKKIDIMIQILEDEIQSIEENTTDSETESSIASEKTAGISTKIRSIFDDVDL